MSRRGRAILTAVLVWVAAAPAAEAGRDARPPGSILFVRDGAIQRIDPLASRAPVPVVALPEGAADRIGPLQTSNDGRTLLFQADGVWHVAAVPEADGTEPAVPRRLDCPGPAALAHSGAWVLCASGDQVLVLYRLTPRLRKIARRVPTTPLHLLQGSEGDALLTHRDTDGGPGLWALPIRGRTGPRLLSPHRPEAHLLPAPNGRRAVGAYPDEGNGASAATALYTFRLNGSSIRRRLIPGEPVVWSADSRWLLVQSEDRACIVRGVGGEFKCWDGYDALALSPDGRYAIVGKRAAGAAGETQAAPRYDLYRAELEGARPLPPRRILEGVPGAVAWVP